MGYNPSMPIYEFTCEACGKTFDELVPASRADASVPCPECGGKKTRKNLSTFAAGGSRPSPEGSGGAGCGPSRGRIG